MIKLVSTETLEVMWTPVKGAELYETTAAQTKDVIHCNDTAPVCALSDLSCNTAYSVTVTPCSDLRGCNRTCKPQTHETGNLNTEEWLFLWNTQIVCKFIWSSDCASLSEAKKIQSMLKVTRYHSTIWKRLNKYGLCRRVTRRKPLLFSSLLLIWGKFSSYGSGFYLAKLLENTSCFTFCLLMWTELQVWISTFSKLSISSFAVMFHSVFVSLYFWSDQLFYVCLAAAPCTPEILNMTQTNSSTYRILFTTPNTPNTNYTITATGRYDRQSCQSTNSSCVLTQLPCGSVYEVTAVATTAVGKSLPGFSKTLETGMTVWLVTLLNPTTKCTIGPPNSNFNLSHMLKLHRAKAGLCF